MKTYRTNGATGALLDEYEKALNELKKLIEPLTKSQLTTIVDHETSDPDCRSIQTILTHVVRSGFGYAIYIRQHQGEDVDFKRRKKLNSANEYIAALDAMFAFNVATFETYPNLELEECDTAKKMRVRWGQLYDVEQIMEHAIVHILRHRRQIERFLIRLEAVDNQ